MKINRLFYLWCLLISAIFLVSSVQNVQSLYQHLKAFDSSRWLHFLAYVAVVAFPVAEWQSRKRIFLSLVVPITSIMFEASFTGVSLSALRMQTIPADVFGIGAGILLGLNIRMMHRSTRQTDNADIDSSRTPAV